MSDNPISGIIGMIVLVQMLPYLMQMLGGLGGSGQQQGGLVPLGQGMFGVGGTQPVQGPGGFVYLPNRVYSSGQGQFTTPLDMSTGFRQPGGPNTFQGMATGPGSLFNAMGFGH